MMEINNFYFFFFQAEDGIRDYKVTGVQTCALPILPRLRRRRALDRHRRPAVQPALLPAVVLRLEDREGIVPTGELARPRARRRLNPRRQRRLTRDQHGGRARS